MSCSAPRACTAVGYLNTGTGDAQPLAEAWNGSHWSLQAAAMPPGTAQSTLSAVSCVTSRCTAVGSYFGPSGVFATLAETRRS